MSKIDKKEQLKPRFFIDKSCSWNHCFTNVTERNIVEEKNEQEKEDGRRRFLLNTAQWFARTESKYYSLAYLT
jgi:hypothetical protein